MVPNVPEKLHSAAVDVFVLVKGSQVWSESRAISVPGSTFLEWGMLI